MVSSEGIFGCILTRMQFDRYFGALASQPLKASGPILKYILCLTGRKWASFRNAVTESFFSKTVSLTVKGHVSFQSLTRSWVYRLEVYVTMSIYLIGHNLVVSHTRRTSCWAGIIMGARGGWKFWKITENQSKNHIEYSSACFID